MEILSVRTLEGPNIYSFNPVLRAKLDIGRYDDVSSSEIEGFSEKLLALLPGLQEHHCSCGCPGGFVLRLKEGTYLAHIFEHTVLELQCMAGDEINFGKTRQDGRPGLYQVVVAYRSAALARQAVYESCRLLTAILQHQSFDVAAGVARIVQAGDQDKLGPSTEAIYQAALARDIPVNRLENESLLILGYGRHCQRVWATLTSRTSALATDLAGDKQLTKRVLEQGGIIVPFGTVVTNAVDAVAAVKRLNCPAVIKPLGGNQGKGVTIGVTGAAETERAFQDASRFDSQVLVEEYIPGLQYRLCVVNGKMVAAAERIPAYVAGDGKHSVAELVEITNCDPGRGEGHGKKLSKIKLDNVAIAVLAKQQLSPQAVPPAGQVVRIRDNANLSTGGTAVDVTDIVHPANSRLAEWAAQLIGLDVAGIDLVARNITQPIGRGNGAVIEVNAAPGIRMHHYPSAGKPRDVGACIVDSLFPEDETGRIPVLAITGTNGKTTVTRMIGHVWRQAGYNVGMTTTDGIYINDRCILSGDTTGPGSARIVLTDSQVDVAVLETARGGIIRGGLAFDRCDVGIVTNITEDHLGQDGIETLDDLAYIKSLVPETVRPGGYALLNADDPCVAAMAPRIRAEVVYFSVEPSNVVVRRHLGTGGKGFFVKEGMIYAACGGLARTVLPVNEIPATLGGIAIHNLQNAVIAAAACYCSKIPLSYIRQGLSSFAQNPGRLNLLTLGDFRVCVDYGHNPAGYQALISTMHRLDAARLVGVVAAPGDRRDDVTLNIGRIAGSGFDFIYIKEDEDLRGRKPGETAELLRRGILDAGFPVDRIVTVLPEKAAVTRALTNAKPSDLIVVFYEKYDVVMAAIQEFREQLILDSAESKAEYETVIAAEAKIL
ncbi:MAG: cyanophycin synthetase [Veillonellales bacterium]